MPRNRTEARVNITGSAKGFRRATKEAATAAERLQKRMQRMGDGLQRMGRTLTTHVTLPIVGGLALATKAALDDEKSQTQLRKAIENNTTATAAQVAGVEEWIDSLARASGIMDDELRPQLSILVAATGDVTAAQHLLTLGMDVAAGTGKSLSTIVLALAKAQNGQTAGLSRLGIKTKAANGQALTFEEIQDRLAQKYNGQWKAAAETHAGRLERAKVALAEMSETLGYVLMPFLEDMADWLQKVAARFENLSPRMQKFIVYGGLATAAFGPLASIIGKVVSGGSGLVGLFIKLTPAVTKTATAATGAGAALSGAAAPATGLATALGAIAAPALIAVAAIVAIGGAFAIAYATSAPFRDWVDNKLWPAARDAFNSVKGGLQKLNAAWKNTFGESFVDVVRDSMRTVGEILTRNLSALGNSLTISLNLIGGNWADAWEGMRQNVQGVNDQMRELYDWVANRLGSFFGRDKGSWIGNFFSNLPLKPGGRFGGLFGGVARGLSNLGDLITPFHSGGVFRSASGTKEGLALLRDREVVFTPEQLAALSSSRSGSITINVNVSGTKATAHDIAREVGWAMLTKGR